jgi:hypothetical protein
MKTNRGKTTISSVRNTRGIRVYIPEKGYINRRLWVRPYKFDGITARQSAPLYLSFTSNVTITVRLTSTTVRITTPFSYKMLLYYVNMAAEGSHYSETVVMLAKEQDEKQLSAQNISNFEKSKSGILKQDAKLIFALGDAIFSPRRETP